MSSNPETTACPGEGRKWQPGMGSAICPVCHRGSRSMGLPAGRKVDGRMSVPGNKTVPAHTIR